jgi:hypothetical protein
VISITGPELELKRSLALAHRAHASRFSPPIVPPARIRS